LKWSWGKANAAEHRHMCQSRKWVWKVQGWKLVTYICFYKEFRFLKLDPHKVYAEIGEGNKQFTKFTFVILSLNTNRKFINKNMHWVKYLIMITLKSDIWSCDSYISHTKLLVKRVRFTVQNLDILGVGVYVMGSQYMGLCGIKN
jgi:hypothetical protein